MRVQRWHNVRADQCSPPRSTAESAVRYQGGEYAVVGLYFAALGGDRPGLCYVLRELEDDEPSKETRGAGAAGPSAASPA